MTTLDANTGAADDVIDSEDAPGAGLEAIGIEIEDESAGAAADGPTEDDAADDAAMLAGFKAASGDDTALATLADKAPAADAGEVPPTETPDKPEPRIVFAGLTEAQLAEKLATIDSLQKGTETLAGRMGNLQQMLTANKGKTLTASTLKRITAEFGEEFAEAFAADLNESGFGGGSQAVDTGAWDAKLDQRATELERKFEFKAVRLAHKDAPEYFAGGKHNAAFVGWIQTLPEERQQVIATAWDSDTVCGFLDDFKAQRDKAAAQAARQTSRVARAVVPTSGSGAGVTQPAEDPMELGWNRARGNRPRVSAQRAGGR
jgi:hypothetical protein